MRIGFIGAGKVGCSLGRYLKEHGIPISGYDSRTYASAEQAADFTGSKPFHSAAELSAESDMIFVTVPDDAIAVVWEQLKNLRLTDKVICHCSGVLSSDIFSKDSDTEIQTYSVHPLLAVSDRLHSYQEFSNALFTIEGEAAIDSEPARILRKCGNQVVELHKKDKVRYHGAAVLGSNLMLGLMEAAQEELQKCGFSRMEARAAMVPFAQANLAHLTDRTIEESLTGPVERADVKTVEAHLQTFEGTNREVYRLLSEKALQIARRKNPDREYEELERTLEIY